MGGSQIKDAASSASPWNTQIVIDNQCTTPVRVYLARKAKRPKVKNSIDHSVPPQSLYTIQSGWLREPLATMILRVGVHEAKILRMPHMTRLTVGLAPSGLEVVSGDENQMIIEDHPDPGAVPQNDTVPMVLKGDSFMDRKPASKDPRPRQDPQSSPARRQADRPIASTPTNWPTSPPSAPAPPPQFSQSQAEAEEESESSESESWEPPESGSQAAAEGSRPAPRGVSA